MKRILVATLLVINCHICFCQTKAEQYMDNPRTALAEAQSAFHSGEYKKALNLIGIYQALSGEKVTPEIYQKVNDCYELLEKERYFEDEGNYVGAIELLNRIKCINPKDDGISSRILHIQRLIGSNLEWVDLGLSVKWATCNVGATTPCDYGDYFAWGAVETLYEEGSAQSDTPKWKSGKENGYIFENCPYWITGHSWKGPDYPTFSKYSPTKKYWGASGNPDNKVVLDLDDDVAHMKYGKIGGCQLDTNLMN